MVPVLVRCLSDMPSQNCSALFLDGIPRAVSNLDLDLRESSRDLTIENGSILAIWGRSRSSNPGALARSKFQIPNRTWYNKAQHQLGGLPFNNSHNNTRLYQHINGSICIRENTFGEIIGQKLIRPFIDMAAARGRQLLNFFKKAPVLVDKAFTAIFIFPVASAEDVGMIAYFEGDCPKGWEPYTHAQGRFVLGSSPTYPLASTGGVANYVLTMQQMPRHQHRTGVAGVYAEPTQLDPVNDGRNGLGGSWWSIGQLYTESEGGSEPVNNMPPYVVLNSCKRVTGVSIVCTTQQGTPNLGIIALAITGAQALISLVMCCRRERHPKPEIV